MLFEEAFGNTLETKTENDNNEIINWLQLMSSCASDKSLFAYV